MRTQTKTQSSTAKTARQQAAQRAARTSTSEDGNNVPNHRFNQADTDQSDRDDDREPPKQLQPRTPAEQAARMASLKTRTISTVCMIAFFLVIIYSGHVPLMALVFTLQILMVRELFRLVRGVHQERKLPFFRAQQWYFFFVAAFYLYLRFIKNNLLVELTSARVLSRLFSWVLKSHSIISYSLYLAGFVSFVLSLRRGSYLYQFSQYAWTHMILLMVFVPSTFFVSSIFEGIIWFILPCFLIVANDIFAYLAGFWWGRTPLIRLSPKKTWEGFIGGCVGTVIFAFYLAQVMSMFQWMTCPRLDLSMGRLSCRQDALYIQTEYRLADMLNVLPPSLTELMPVLSRQLPAGLCQVLGDLRLKAVPMQVHAMVLAIFASLIAPFGGFFASGFKRAFKMKDFGDTIPGHGGITDRFDCQVLMAMFSYIYYWNFVSKPDVLSVGDALSTALRLDGAAQLELFIKLGNLLAGEGLLPYKMMDMLSSYYANRTREVAGHSSWLGSVPS